MGKISSTSTSVTVEFSIQEALERTALLRLPDQNLLGFDTIGNFLSRSAWEIIKEKAPHLARRVEITDVSGAGTVHITFTYEVDNA